MRSITPVMAVIVVIGLSPAVAGAQSRYLDRGVSGVGIDAGPVTSEHADGFSLYLGYSHQGRSDFGITIEHTSGDIDLKALMKAPAIASLFNKDIRVLRVSPGIAGYVINQAEGFPVSVGLGCAYVEEYFTGGDIDDSGLDIFTRGIGFSIFLDREQPVSGKMDIYPTASISFHAFKATAGSLSGGGSFEAFEYDSLLSCCLGLGIAFRQGDRSTLYIMPSMVFDDEGSTFCRIGLGYILSTISER